MFQHSPSALRPATAAGRRDFALRLYAAACAEPASHNWRAVADALHAALPAARASKAAGSDVPAWWQDYRPGKRFQAESVEVTFADGRRVRLSMCSDPGKPANIGRAVRVACLFYRSKVHNALGAPVAMGGTTLRGPAEHVAVPAVAHVEAVDSGETWDAATCTRLTADVRAGTWCEAEARETAEAVAADPRALAVWAAERGCMWLPDNAARAVMVWLFCEAWRAAYGAAEDAAHAANVARHAAVAADRAAAFLAGADARAEAWCAAVADSYGAPAWAELSGTMDAAGPAIHGTGVAAEAERAGARPARARRGRRPAAVPAAAAPEATLISAATIVAPDLNAGPVEAIGSGEPVEAIGAASGPCPPTAGPEADALPGADTHSATGPVEAIADAWQPSAVSHPFVVRCGSKAAREKLFAVILDGTFPAGPADDGARGGFWRLTAEDAAAARRIARTVVTHSPGA